MMPEDEGPTYDPPRSSVEKVYAELDHMAQAPAEELLQLPGGAILAMAAPVLPALKTSIPTDAEELDAQLAGGAAFLLSLRSDDAPVLLEHPGEVNGKAEELPGQ